MPKSMSSGSDPEKAFNVVFERKTPMSDEETQPECPVLNLRAKTIIRDVAKQALRKRIEEIQSEHQDIKDPVDTKFSRLLDAVGHSAVQEVRATDKFVDDVEQMMKSFNKDIGKLQTTYKNIMEKLPKIKSTEST